MLHFIIPTVRTDEQTATCVGFFYLPTTEAATAATTKQNNKYVKTILESVSISSEVCISNFFVYARNEFLYSFWNTQ